MPIESRCEYCHRYLVVQSWMGEDVLLHVCTSTKDLSCRIAQKAYERGFQDGIEQRDEW